MNYLAHLYLSGADEDLLLGNFIGDSIRGDQFERLDPAVQAGVSLHRSIDRFTDSHCVVGRTKALMRNDFGRYAAVVADVFFDHFLARDWRDYHPVALPEYASHIYRTLASRLQQCPPRSRDFFQYMVRVDVLTNYATIKGIEDVLCKMAQRTRFVSGMEQAGEVLRQRYDALEKYFLAFFPELTAFADREIDRLRND